MNDPAIYMVLTGPPYPYTQESFDGFFDEVLAPSAQLASEEMLEVLIAKGRGETKWVGTRVPFPTIRVEDPKTGEQRFLGQFDVRRRSYLKEMVGSQEEATRLTEVNNAREAGDPETEYEIGCKRCSHFWILIRFVSVFHPSSNFRLQCICGQEKTNLIVCSLGSARISWSGDHASCFVNRDQGIFRAVYEC
jgi:hypothetical protein